MISEAAVIKGMVDKSWSVITLSVLYLIPNFFLKGININNSKPFTLNSR